MPKTIAIDARKLLDFGIGTYVRQIILGLARLDSEHCFVLLVGDEDLARKELGPLPGNFTTVTETAPVYSLRELTSVTRTLRAINADLYHATHYTLPLRPPCPCVVTIHDLIHLLFPEFLPNRAALIYARWMMRRAGRIAAQVIAVSAHTATDVARDLGVDQERISVIHNGVDPSFGAPATDEAAQRLHVEHQLEPGYILFVGNPKPHKNLDRVLDAYSQARALDSSLAPLVLAGTGSETVAVVQRLKTLGIEDAVHLLGYVEEDLLPVLYQQASLFVLVSLYEGFGLPVVEAMAAGTPVVTSNASALAEVAGDAACLVNPLDTDAIASAIHRLSASREERTRLSELGRERAQRFSWQKASEQTFTVYNQALGLVP